MPWRTLKDHFKGGTYQGGFGFVLYNEHDLDYTIKIFIIFTECA
jgi:hypothetical protein